MVVTLGDLRGDEDGAGGGGGDGPSVYSGIQRARPTQSSARPGQRRPGTDSRSSPNTSFPQHGTLSPSSIKAMAFTVALACLIWAKRPANPFAEGAIPAAARPPGEHWDAILKWPTFTRHLTSYARAPPKASWWRGGKLSLTEELQGVDYGGEDGHEPEALRLVRLVHHKSITWHSRGMVHHVAWHGAAHGAPHDAPHRGSTRTIRQWAAPSPSPRPVLTWDPNPNPTLTLTLTLTCVDTSRMRPVRTRPSLLRAVRPKAQASLPQEGKGGVCTYAVHVHVPASGVASQAATRC